MSTRYVMHVLDLTKPQRAVKTQSKKITSTKTFERCFGHYYLLAKLRSHSNHEPYDSALKHQHVPHVVTMVSSIFKNSFIRANPVAVTKGFSIDCD